MSRRTQHIIISLLLTSYLFVGAVAHLESIGHFFSFDERPQKLDRGRAAQPPLAVVCWNQYKHIPSFAQDLSLSPAVITQGERPPREHYTRISAPADVNPRLFRINVCLASRAPPLSAVAS